MDFNLMINRMIRAARLEPAFYNEVEEDTSLNQEALMVVLITAVAGGIGGFGAGLIAGVGFGAALLGLLWGVVWGVIGYYLWAYITLFVGTRLFNGTADIGELLRTLGYATAPRILGIFALIPCVGGLLALAGAIWSLVAGIIAVREALDLDTTNAVLTVIVGWVIVLVISLVVGSIFGLGAFGANVLGGMLSG